jgi:hypothetical protein
MNFSKTLRMFLLLLPAFAKKGFGASMAQSVIARSATAEGRRPGWASVKTILNIQPYFENTP